MSRRAWDPSLMYVMDAFPWWTPILDLGRYPRILVACRWCDSNHWALTRARAARELLAHHEPGSVQCLRDAAEFERERRESWQ